MCEMCLDGVPYTSDSAGRVYCITDFHKYGESDVIKTVFMSKLHDEPNGCPTHTVDS